MTDASIRPGERLVFALFLALSLHAALILGINFATEAERPPAQTIDVTLTRYEEPEAPEQADFVAATNQHGSGTAQDVIETTARHETDFVAPVPAPRALEQAPREQTNDIQRTVLTTTTVAEERVAREPPTPREPVEVPSLRPGFSFDDVAAEIASLEARIAEQQEAEARRPRVRRLTSVSARSATEAGYLNAWRQRIERIGNANYPGGGIDGSLRMLVVVRFDGGLEQVRLLEPSGHRALDEAALRIVRLAAPFPPFPVEMRKQYDHLEIIRTWQFSRYGAHLE